MDIDETAPALDADKDFKDFFKALPEVGKLVRIFDRNGFFSIHGESATQAATELYQTQTVVKSVSSIPCLTMTKTVCERYIRSALQHGMRIQIWEGSRSSWRISREASPGNTQALEGVLFSADSGGTTILSLHIQKGKDGIVVGACFSDLDRRMLGITEFLDTDTYTNLESMMIQLGVRECLIPETAVDVLTRKRLESVLERCNVSSTLLKTSDYSSPAIHSDLEMLFGDQQSSSAWNKLALGISAAAGLMKYLDLLKTLIVNGQFRYWRYDIAKYMRLDDSALKALSLLPSSQDGVNTTMNLFGLLNRCRTALGSRLLSQWLKQPLLDVLEIEQRHYLVHCFVQEGETREALQSELKVMPDLFKLSNKFMRGLANLEDVVRIYQVTTRVPHIITAFDLSNTEEAFQEALRVAYVDKLEEVQFLLQKFQDLVETTVDLDALERHEYLIRADFDDNLGDLQIKIDHTRSLIETESRLVAESLGLELDKKLKLENHSIFGFCLRLSRTDASAIRNKSGYKELQTAKAGVYFSTNRLLSLAKSYTDHYSQYCRHQKGLVREVVTIAASYCPVLESFAQLVANLDVIMAFAHVSVHAPTAYVKPNMYPLGTGDTILVDARHPCIEAQDDVRFIANDISFIRGQAEFLIITGANMGGKSTYIRQVGMITLMAQIGCFVPCSSAQIVVVDAILARVGAGDSQLRGVSTFMSECLETSTILRAASKNSLIIIDELGRGTSTTDGFGLAFAISEHIIETIGCFTLFATHFHELTSIGETHNVVKNLHVSTHVEQSIGVTGVTLLYKVSDGPCNQSFGIHVAELARFPKDIVDMAKRKLQELDELDTDGTETVGTVKRRFSVNKLELRHVLQKLGNDKPDVRTLQRLMRAVTSRSPDPQTSI